MYFATFPVIDYGDNTIRDISRVVYIPDEIRNNIALWKDYDIRDGQTPDNIAYDYYGDSNLHWVVLLMNDIVDPFFDWPLTVTQLRRHVIENFGVANINTLHHWELNSEVVPAGTNNAVAISNMMFMEKANEAKRTIKLLNPEFIPQIISEFKKQINGVVGA